jgi:hypothetical protein
MISILTVRNIAAHFFAKFHASKALPFIQAARQQQRGFWSAEGSRQFNRPFQEVAN